VNERANHSDYCVNLTFPVFPEETMMLMGTKPSWKCRLKKAMPIGRLPDTVRCRVLGKTFCLNLR
jgi:hypothetical protein